jgi:putative hydrolase
VGARARPRPAGSPGCNGAAPNTLTIVTPSEALERVVHYLDRAHETGFKAKAFVRAAEVVRSLPEGEIEERAKNNTLKQLDGIGDSSAKVILEALRGDTAYLDKMDRETKVKITPEGQKFRDALRGDCHLHSKWSDGGATIEAMANTAIALGHEYMVLTDHSARLTIAHGLDRERLLKQLADIETLNKKLAPFRILTGMEVDILEDGGLDLDDDMLETLDVVVASVHSKLRMDRFPMTQRMLRAVESPHVDILGHCTGRMIGKRPESEFDADKVFAACAANNTAVEFNSRPERLDPPESLVAKAIAAGCYFSIDSDAHATGQLEWQPHGCDRAAATGVDIDRVINTWSVEDLLEWTTA